MLLDDSRLHSLKSPWHAWLLPEALISLEFQLWLIVCGGYFNEGLFTLSFARCGRKIKHQCLPMYNPISCLFLLPIFIPISVSLSIFFPPRSPVWATVWSLRPVFEQSTSLQPALQSSRSRSNSRWISPTQRAQLPPRRMASTLSPSPCSQVRTHSQSYYLSTNPLCLSYIHWIQIAWNTMSTSLSES